MYYTKFKSEMLKSEELVCLARFLEPKVGFLDFEKRCTVHVAVVRASQDDYEEGVKRWTVVEIFHPRIYLNKDIYNYIQ